MKPYIISLSEPGLDDGLDRPVGLEGAELGGDIQFTNNRRVVAPSKLSQQIANQGGSPRHLQ